MKVILIGTRHDEDEEIDIEVVLECEGSDTWTFKIPGIEFTVSDLDSAMEFLSEEFYKEGE